jgi:uncharacterized protein (TIGR03435 family)
MTARFLAALGCCLLLAATGFSQAPSSTQALAFEVASIKPSPELQPRAIISGGALPKMGMRVDGARVELGYMSLAGLIRIAYRVQSYQITGPEWISTERFDVSAKLPDGASKEQVPEMLQALLAERFKLTLHHSQKEQAVFALVVGKDGLKIKETEPDPETSEDGSGPGNGGEKPMRAGGVSSDGGAMVFRSRGGPASGSGAFGSGSIPINRKFTMPLLAEFLSRFVDRPILDQTEVKGLYQVSLEIPLADFFHAGAGNVTINGGGANPDALQTFKDHLAENSSGSVFASVQKLGLKLESRKASLDLLVVDHADKTPTEN